MKRLLAASLVFFACTMALAQGRSNNRSIVENLSDALNETSTVQSSSLATTLSSTLLVPPYLDLDEATNWLTCGNCGNTGGVGPTATYWMKPQSSVSLDGMAAQFYINGAGQAYADGFWYIHRSGDYSGYKKFSYGFFVYVPLSASPQALEFQVQQVIAGRVYNWAWQAEWHSKIWRTYDYSLRKWSATQIPVALDPGKWHYIEEVAHRDATAATAVIDSLIVDGIVYPVSIVHDSVAAYSSTSNDLNNAFQLDTNSSGSAYSVFVDRMQLTAN